MTFDIVDNLENHILQIFYHILRIVQGSFSASSGTEILCIMQLCEPDFSSALCAISENTKYDRQQVYTCLESPYHTYSC